jgi:hypothetical protein
MRRFDWWARDVQGLGDGNSMIPIESIAVTVDEKDSLDSRHLGTDKLYKQVWKANKLSKYRTRFEELEASGKRFVLLANCDINATVEGIGGGGREGLRKDKEQVVWLKDELPRQD